MTNRAKSTSARSTGRKTLVDVAEAAGVSPMTVSRTLAGDPRVREDLVRRVHDAVAALNYVPNSAAQALASSRTRTVAILLPLLSNRVFSDLLQSTQERLLENGYQTVFGLTKYRPEAEERLLQAYLALRPSGLILTGFDQTDSCREILNSQEIPCVHLMEIGRQAETYSVGFSQFDAGSAMTSHLLDRGRRHIAFACAQLDPRAMQRMEGYRHRLAQAGLHDPSLEFLRTEPSSADLGAALLLEMVQNHPEIDAIFFANDNLAQGALVAAQRMGIRVPERISIAGYNDLDGSSVMTLTTVRTPRAAIGDRAAWMLIALMRGEPVAEHHVDLGFELVIRGTT